MVKNYCNIDIGIYLYLGQQSLLYKNCSVNKFKTLEFTVSYHERVCDINLKYIYHDRFSDKFFAQNLQYFPQISEHWKLQSSTYKQLLFYEKDCEAHPS